MPEKITLVCTSLNPDQELLNKMLKSAKGFDEMFLHVDGEGKTYYKNGNSNGFFYDSSRYSIPDSYNKLIDSVNTEWVCCFCDDDYFYEDNLKKMIEEVHKGIDADVAHFRFRISGHIPPQDMRCWFGINEYNLGEGKPVTLKLLAKHNRLPAGSFFRKSAWDKVDGFQGDKHHDWNLWKRMAEAGMKFKYFDHLVYNFVRRENSAWCRQSA